MSDFVFRREGVLEKLKMWLSRAQSFFSTKFAFAKSSSQGKIWAMKWFVIIFALIFGIEALIYLVLIPSMQRPSVIWSGAKSFSTTELSRTISPLLEKSWAKFKSEDAVSLLTSISALEDVQVVKRFPDKVYINVTERTPIAMTFVQSAGRTIPLQIDKNGVLFSARSTPQRACPLVSGIPFENSSSGLRFPAKYRGLMEEISAISALSQNYFAAISEINVVPKDSGNYELILYPIHSKVKILTGRQLTEEAFQRMMVALDVVNRIESGVSEIDLRYGSISYRTRQSKGAEF